VSDIDKEGSFLGMHVFLHFYGQNQVKSGLARLLNAFDLNFMNKKMSSSQTVFAVFSPNELNSHH